MVFYYYFKFIRNKVFINFAKELLDLMSNIQLGTRNNAQRFNCKNYCANSKLLIVGDPYSLINK